MTFLEDLGTKRLVGGPAVNGTPTRGCVAGLRGAQHHVSTPLNSPEERVVWKNAAGEALGLPSWTRSQCPHSRSRDLYHELAVRIRLIGLSTEGGRPSGGQ